MGTVVNLVCPSFNACISRLRIKYFLSQRFEQHRSTKKSRFISNLYVSPSLDFFQAKRYLITFLLK